MMSPDRISGAAVAWRSAVRLWPLLILLQEAGQAGVIRSRELELHAPPRSNHRLREIGVRGQQQVTVSADKLPQLIDFCLGQVGLISHPDGAMFQRVDRVFAGTGWS